MELLNCQSTSEMFRVFNPLNHYTFRPYSMKNLFTFLILTMSLQLSAQNKLIYVGDPMCSWCYGFSEELLEIVEAQEGKLELEIVMGGLRPYNQETMTDLKSFLTHHWEDVHKASGQEFTYDILDRSDLKYDTEPPCRASVVVRAMAAEKELKFFKMVQRAFYFENLDLNQASSYHAILRNLDLDTAEFDRLFASEEHKIAVKKDFERAGALGVRSFPTLLVEVNGELSVVAQGYAKADKVNAVISKIVPQ